MGKHWKHWIKVNEWCYEREGDGGLLMDNRGRWWWFPWDFDKEKQGPFLNLTSAKAMVYFFKRSWSQANGAH